MIPILYGPEEAAFESNGIGRLTDCLSCLVTEERNGIYEVEFTYPITGAHYADIQEGCIIACKHDDTSDLQPFDIYGRSAPINGIVTFYAHHISYRLTNVIVMPFEASSITQAMARLKSNCITNNPFSLWTDRSTTGDFKVSTPSSLRSRLGGSAGSILDVYGSGDYMWDKWAVRLYADRGSDTGVQILYGKNLTDLTQDITYEGTYSAVMPYWSNDDGTDVVVLPGLIYASGMRSRKSVWTDENTDNVTDENGNPIDITYAIVEAVPLDLSGDFDERPTVEQLRDKARTRLNASRAWLPDENVRVDFAQLWQTEDYKDVAPLQRVSLCDTVTVSYPALGVEKIKQKVVKVVYDCLLERYDSMELGQAKTTLTDIVKGDTSAMLTRMATRTGLAEAIDAATKLIQGGLGGHVVMGTDPEGNPNEILILDTDSISTAVNVLRINMNGIGFSSNGYNGPFKTAWTLDGHFNANYIDTGVLSANLIKAGIIQGNNDDGNYWNLDTDELVLKNAKINITTSDSSYDAIELNASSGDWYLRMTPLELFLRNLHQSAQLMIQAHGIWGYTKNGNAWSQDVHLGTDGSLNLGGGQNAGGLYVKDASGTPRARLTAGTLYLVDASGTLRTRLFSSGYIELVDASDDKAIGIDSADRTVKVFDSNGTARVILLQDDDPSEDQSGLILQDSSGTRIGWFTDKYFQYGADNAAHIAYENSDINLYDASNVLRSKLAPGTFRVYDNAGQTRTTIQGSSIWWYDSSGNQLATFQQGDLWLDGLSGSVVANISDHESRIAALETPDTWTSTAWAGLTCKAYYKAGTVMITLRGTTTSSLGTAQATRAVCTLPAKFCPVATYTQYVNYGAAYKGQLVLNANGTVSIGYTRQFTATANEDLPSGTNIYIAATFVTA